MLFFQFIITFILTVKILMFLRGSTEKIHGRSLDPYNIVNQFNLKVVTKRIYQENWACLKKVSEKYSSDYNRMLPRNIFIQKKSPKGVSIKVVLKICNFTEITFQRGCSSVNLMYIFRCFFYSNTSGNCFCFYCFV